MAKETRVLVLTVTGKKKNRQTVFDSIRCMEGVQYDEYKRLPRNPILIAWIGDKGMEGDWI